MTFSMQSTCSESPGFPLEDQILRPADLRGKEGQASREFAKASSVFVCHFVVFAKQKNDVFP